MFQTSITNVYQKMIYAKRSIQYHCSTILNRFIDGYPPYPCKLGVRQ